MDYVREYDEYGTGRPSVIGIDRTPELTDEMPPPAPPPAYTEGQTKPPHAGGPDGIRNRPRLHLAPGENGILGGDPAGNSTGIYAATQPGGANAAPTPAAAQAPQQAPGHGTLLLVGLGVWLIFGGNK